MITTTNRNTDLRHLFSEHRREVQDDVQSRIREGRIDRSAEVRDEIDMSDAHIQGDIECTLLQMRADSLARIDQALFGIETGSYGSCCECASEISEQRLRAQPFAVRCLACEEAREQAQGRARQFVQRRSNLATFSNGLRP